MTTEKVEIRWHRRLLWPGVALLAVALPLLILAWWGIDWKALRGEWNEHGLAVYLARQAWLLFAVFGGVLVLVNRLYAWPFLRSAEMLVLLICVSILGCMLWPEFAPPLGDAWGNCINNQRQIAVAVQIYTQDHDWKYPPSLEEFQWVDEMKCYGNGKPYSRWGGYGLNAHLAGKRMQESLDASHVILTADCITPNGLLSTPADIAKRHRGGYIASFPDGHVSYLEEDMPLEMQ